MTDLEDLMEVIDIAGDGDAEGNDEEWIHWCWVEDFLVNQ